MNITDIDLKSLEILEALVAERNVTRAARRVGLSQPAVSNTLARLRERLGDPLLVRTSQGMIPTARAESLVGPIRAALGLLQGALAQPNAFAPETSQARFMLGATDYAAWLLLPGLCTRLARKAPHVRLEVGPQTERVPARALERGEIDLAAGFFPDPPGNLYQRELFQETFVAVVSRKSAPARGTWTLKQFTALRHLLVTPWGGMVGTMDSALAEQGVARTVFVSITQFLVAPAIAAGAEYVVTLPRRLARSFAELYPLTLCELPVKLPPLSFRLLWHERTHKEAEHVWFREVVGEITTGG